MATQDANVGHLYRWTTLDFQFCILPAKSQTQMGETRIENLKNIGVSPNCVSMISVLLAREANLTLSK
jgi:hypothetical protein